MRHSLTLMLSRWLSPTIAAAYLTTTAGGLRALTKLGKIPPPNYQLGPRRPRWDRLALDAAMRAALVGRYSTDPDVLIALMRQQSASE
ncbi:MAG: hypothetical protein ACRYG8_06060 [Janthinobacterium lividum]